MTSTAAEAATDAKQIIKSLRSFSKSCRKNLKGCRSEYCDGMRELLGQVDDAILAVYRGLVWDSKHEAWAKP